MALSLCIKLIKRMNRAELRGLDTEQKGINQELWFYFLCLILEETSMRNLCVIFLSLFGAQTSSPVGVLYNFTLHIHLIFKEIPEISVYIKTL